MIFANSLLGSISMVCGAILIGYYQKLKRENKTGGLSTGIQTGGIGLVMIGISLIIKDLNFLIDYLNRWTL
jgi:hypothetical protein